MIGVDIVKISRIAHIINRYPEKFIRKVFTAHEIGQSLRYSHPQKKIQYLAKRFAAKEAYTKAIGTLGQLNFKDIGVHNDANGRPYLCVNNNKVANADISLSDDGDYAIAMVILK